MVRKRPDHEFDGGVIGGKGSIGIIEMAEGTTVILCTGQRAFWSRRGSEFPKGIRSERDRSRLEGNSAGSEILNFVTEFACCKYPKPGVIGPCTSIVKKGPTNTNTARGNTIAWKICSLESWQEFVLIFHQVIRQIYQS
ncbi:hypothetical protein M0R45_013900 [Rubus argutus]|uniref:Uncharacterized protein n=1 Tax=Rubus argutus TaxID=59490 RepID=A0AAW1XL41_RUBAR